MTDLALRPLDADALVGDPRSSRADATFRIVTRSAGYIVLLILAGIAVAMTLEAWPAFRSEGFDYLSTDNWVPSQGTFGALAIIYGTLVVSFIGIIVAVPISVGIALFVTEVAPRRVASAITTVMDVLAAVPSVVFGLWAFVMLRPSLKGVYNSIADAVSGVPGLNKVFGPSLSGQSFMTAGLIVGLMITPIVTSILREVFRTVPTNDKHGALALGATRWEMIRGVTFPHSTGGFVGAVMLGLGRAMGETIAVALIIGASPQIGTNMFAQGEAMPSVIARNLNESDGVFRAALIGLGVVLFFVTILINMSARGAVRIINRRTMGAA